MDDVKPEQPAVEPQSTEAAPETASPVQQEVKPAEAESAEKAAPIQQDKTVPYAALKEERKMRQELQRKLAQYEAKQQAQARQPNDDEDYSRVMNHPYVQNLLIQQAKRDLVDFAKETLDKFPSLPEQVKKAIIKNPRGFVQESTTDIENAKLDLQEYIEELVEGMQAQATPQAAKAFAVAATNATPSESAIRPADVQKILEKPVDEWSEQEVKIVDEYRQSQPRK